MKSQYFKLLALNMTWGSLVFAESDNTSNLAMDVHTYPNGLYPGVAPAEQHRRVPRDGGFQVLPSLTNVTEFRNGASKGGADSDGYNFQNIRVKSDQTNLDDYLVGYYQFDLSSQRLMPLKFERAPNVGVFEVDYKFLMKDMVDPVNFHINPSTPNQFLQGNPYTFQSETDYYANLTVGQRLCVVLSNFPSNRLFRLVILTEDGSTYIDTRANTGGFSVITYSSLPVLTSGRYKMRIEAVSPATAFSFRTYFYNENGFATNTIVSGNTISVSLAGNGSGYGLPYRKFRIALTAGQTFDLPGDLDTNAWLIDGDGAVISGGGNAGINVPVTKTGDYYVVIQPRDSVSGSSESYTGTVTVTDSLSFQNWAWSRQLAYGKDRAGDDADGDGMTNLLEYALGSNPSSSTGSAPLAQSLSPTSQTLRYAKPNYVTGVTVMPQFAGENFQWQDATPVADGTENGVPHFKASVPRQSSGKGFSRVKVTQPQ